MMNVLIDMPVFEPALQALKEMNGITVKCVDPSSTSRTLPENEIEDIDVLFCSVPPANHQQMKRLKWIQISSAGYAQLTGQHFEERNISACNALGVFDIPIAEWNIAMMINLARDFRQMIRNQENQVWDRSAKFQHEIRGSVVGIWGYGGIGRETARLCKSLGMKTHVLSRYGVKPRVDVYHIEGTGDPEGVLPDQVFSPAKKRTFLEHLDFLIMAIPHTRSTEGIVGEEELKMLKPTAFLLNPARGPLVQEQALLRALNEGWIAGAALDTHYQYPLPPEHPLWHMKQVILTPHISGSSSSTHFLERTWDIFLQNLVRFNSGQPLLNELSPSALRGD